MSTLDENPVTEDLASADNGVSEVTAEEQVNGEDNTDNVEHREISVTDGHGAPLRQGTISSARFNILCTMVGGGCLSLPFAFQKTGNALFGPFLLVLTAMITEYCFRIIVSAIRRLSPVNGNTSVIGKDSFESLASAAFGSQGFLFAKHLVTAMCFFGAVGYAVLLRDMLEPISDALLHHFQHHHHHHATNGTVIPTNGTIIPTNGTIIINGTMMAVMSMYDMMMLGEEDSKEEVEGGPSLVSNLTMLTVILLITPVCTLKNLSSLEKLGAASMSSILILGGCIVYRSLQCNMGHLDTFMYDDAPVWPAFKLFPDSWKDVLGEFSQIRLCIF